VSDQIDNNELFGGDLFGGNPLKNIQILLPLVQQLNTEFTNLGKTLKSAFGAGALPKTKKDLDDFTKAEKQAKVASDTLNKTKQEELKLRERLKQANSDQIQQNEQLKVQLTEQRKINKNLAKETLGLVNSYDRLVKETNEAQNNFKKLAAEFGVNSTQAKKASKIFLQLDNRLRNINTAARDGRRDVGRYSIALGNARARLISVAQAAGITGGLFGAFRLFRNATETVRTFEKANAELAGVLGKTRDEIRPLTEDALRLGSVTTKTATDVNKLQIAFSRLGFSQEQVLALTEPTINGSIALNAGLEETAELTGAIVNTFDDFSAVNAPEILDQLTVATQSSALNFEKLNTSLPIVAGAANAAGVPFNKLLALLGKLSDAGIDASSSSTALRNIFIESAKQGLNYEEILSKIVNEQDKLTSATDEFGKRAAVSATVLSANIAATEELAESIANAGGAAERVAEEQLDTLDGSIQLLTSAWEGFILSLNDGTGVITGGLRRAVQFLAKNLVTILKVIGSLVAGFIAFKTVLIVVSLAAKIHAITLRAAAAAQTLFNGGIKIGTVLMRLFNKVTKLNPIGLLIGALTAAAVAFGFFSDSADEATESQKELNEAVKEGQKLLDDIAELEARGRTVSKLSKKQLKDFIADIDTRIDENSRKNAAILKQEQSVAEPIRRLRENLLNENIRLNTELLEADLKVSRRLEITARLRRNNEVLQANLTVDAQVKNLEGFTKSISIENAKRLQILKKAAEAQLRLIPPSGETDEEKKARIKREKLRVKEDEANLKRFLELQANDDRRAENARKARIDLAKFIAFTEEDQVAAVIRQRNKDLENLDLTEDERILIITKAEKDISDIRQKFRDAEKVASDEAAEQQKIKDDEAAELKKKRIQDAVDTVNAIANIQRKAFDERIKLIDKEINASKKREDAFRALAQKGSEDAEENLAFEQRKQAEAERERERQIRRQANIELIITGINTFNQKVQQGDKSPLASTIRDITLLTQVLQNLPLFFEGTEHIGKSLGQPDLPGRDGYVVRTDGTERIVPGVDNKKMDGVSNPVLGDLAKMYKMGMLTNMGDDPNINLMYPYQSNQELMQKVDKLDASIRAIPGSMTQFNMTYDEFERLVLEIYKSQDKTVVNKSKVGRRFD